MMTREEKKYLSNFLEAHNEDLRDLQNAIRSRNESMLCGIYGTISGGCREFLEVLHDFNLFFDSESSLLEFITNQYNDTGFSDCYTLEEYIEHCMEDVAKTRDGYVLKLYY